MGASVACAWVESPLQLLGAVEYAAATGAPVRVIPRAGAAQLPATIDRLLALGVPDGVTFSLPRSLPVDGIVGLASRHWVVGDVFSGVVHSLLAMRLPARLTVVDDGLASLDIPAVLEGRRPLTRSGELATGISAIAEARLRALQPAGRLELFSAWSLGAIPPRNTFAWLRSRPTTCPAAGTIVLGSAAVTDGLVPLDTYLAWVAGQPQGAAYFPHRRESAEQLAAVAALGLTVRETGLPIELALAGARDLRVISLPSSAVETLGMVLADSGSTIEVQGLSDRIAA